jgi:ATP-binding cassette subfamily B protein
VLGPLGELASSATLYQETKASLGRVEELLAQQPAPRDANAQDVGQVSTIAFDGVSFAYQSTLEKSALVNLNLSIKAGETVAFVGPSGSGKTTLVKLITGLYNPTSGTIAYNGVAEDKVDFDILRKKIGLVAQDVQLFAGTIRENLVFVKQGATDEECLHVLAEAEASSILMRSGEGLDTKIGEGGLKLSGGERQRLAIARALLRHPDVLIFDEATSALDSITEHAITETIRKVSETEQQMIKILIAHRLSTIRHADRIYVLEKGKIIESGTHQSLLDAQGLYAALWRGQSSEAEMV